jgi:hypothetical protein
VNGTGVVGMKIKEISMGCLVNLVLDSKSENGRAVGVGLVVQMVLFLCSSWREHRSLVFGTMLFAHTHRYQWKFALLNLLFLSTSS